MAVVKHDDGKLAAGSKLMTLKDVFGFKMIDASTSTMTSVTSDKYADRSTDPMAKMHLNGTEIFDNICRVE